MYFIYNYFIYKKLILNIGILYIVFSNFIHMKHKIKLLNKLIQKYIVLCLNDFILLIINYLILHISSLGRYGCADCINSIRRVTN